MQRLSGSKDKVNAEYDNFMSAQLKAATFLKQGGEATGDAGWCQH